MSNLLDMYDLGKTVTIGLVGGRHITGTVTGAGDIALIEWSDSEKDYLVKVRQESIDNVTYVIGEHNDTIRKVVPVQRQKGQRRGAFEVAIETEYVG